MTHKHIRRFQIEGEFRSDAEIPLTRSNYEVLLCNDMRHQGYAPMLDIDSAWSTHYVEDGDRWFFKLTIHGIYLGKKRALKCEGMLGGLEVPRDTQRAT
jgi:hypothetical protein